MLIVYSINNINNLIIKYMKNNKKSPVKNKNIKGKIGSEGGYYIDNCPVLIPKENIKFFTAMQKACSVNPYGNYGNAYNKKLL